MKTLIVLLLTFASLAAAQSIEADPPYDAPNAQQMAQVRWGYAMFGWMPPPTGWACEWQAMEGYPYSGMVVYCEPDPINEKYIAYLLWLQQVMEINHFLRRGGM